MVRSIDALPEEAWDRLDHGGSPFLESGMLRALEESDSLGPAAGWEPRYILAEDGAELVGGLAAFVKSHSFGEFIFDWEWARASMRAGIPYYPKLVVAAPVSPATGPRLLLGLGDRRAIGRALLDAARGVAEDEGCSSLHVLFCTAEDRALLVDLGMAARATYQFHWHNRGYRTVDDFLARMTSRRRKQARKERERARAAVDAIDWLAGADLGPADLAAMDRFYRDNVDAHGGTAYLEPGFFELLARYLPDRVRMVRAVRDGRPVAGAFFLEGTRALYGRYWGADAEIPFLHFEITCWQGIERCIERGLPLYEAGAQGTHKLLRGFEPSPTYSCHELYHPAVDRAVRQFLIEEERAVAHHMRRLAEAGPFKADPDPEPEAEPE